MTIIPVSIGMALNPRTRPLFDSRVKPDGIDLVCSPVHASELFWRQLKYAEFDISEMSMSSLMIALANSDDRWIGLPIFTTRYMFHTWILVRRDAGISTPADLKGKRVGVPEYQQTAALWIRGILQHEFGVLPQDMTFWMERTPDKSHGGATGFSPPAGVVINQIPVDKSIGSMMINGELDATLLYLTDRNLVDRSRIDLENHPDIAYLFPDRRAEAMRYYQKSDIYPINHGMMIKRSLAEKHPWAVLNIYKAFQEANALCEAERMEHVAYHVETGLADPDLLVQPLCQHGVPVNRHVLETAARFSYEQGLTPRLMKLEEIFAPCTLDV